MGQAATDEAGVNAGQTSEIDAFRERVRELREKLERAQGAPVEEPPLAQPVISTPSTPIRRPEPPVARAPAPAPQMAALPAAIEQRMLEATQRIEQLAAREHDLTNLLRRTRAELDASERSQEQALEELRIAEERMRGFHEDGEQARAVAEGLRQQVDAQRKRVEALGAENRALQERNERLNDEVRQAAARESAARDELQRLQSTFDALQQSYDEVRRQKGELEINLTRTSGRIEEFENELMGQLQSLESEYARIEGESNGHRERAEAVEGERDRLAAELAARDEAIEELRRSVVEGEQRRSDEAEKRRTIDARLESLQEELSGLQSRYAADLVELDAARQNAQRFEKRAADLTDELNAYRDMQRQHESAFAQMDSLFRSLDAAKAPGAADEADVEPVVSAAPAPAAPKPVAARPVAQPVKSTPVAVKATPAAPAPRPVATVVKAAPKPAPVAPKPVAPKPVAPKLAATTSERPAISKEEAAANARERLGKSLEALQALASRRDAPATQAAGAEKVASTAPAPVAHAPKPVAPAAPAVEPTPVATLAETAPAADAAPETGAAGGFIMPKPRLIKRPG